MRVARKICILETTLCNKIFIEICSHPIISWFFYYPPISHENILWPPAFSWPPYSEDNDSPLESFQHSRDFAIHMLQEKVALFYFSFDSLTERKYVSENIPKINSTVKHHWEMCFSEESY